MSIQSVYENFFSPGTNLYDHLSELTAVNEIVPIMPRCERKNNCAGLMFSLELHGYEQLLVIAGQEDCYNMSV